MARALRQTSCMTEPETRTAASPPPLPHEVTETIRAAFSKKATDVVVLDLRGTGAFTDFFVICSGRHTRQAKAIADAIEEALRRVGGRRALVEGYSRAEWVLLDFFNFVVHVFTPQTRSFYDLERLWGNAIRIEIADEHRTSPPTSAP